MSYSGPCIVRLPGESDHVPRIAEERRGYVTVLTDHHLLKICPIAPPPNESSRLPFKFESDHVPRMRERRRGTVTL